MNHCKSEVPKKSWDYVSSFRNTRKGICFRKKRDVFYNSNFSKHLWRISSKTSNRNSKVLVSRKERKDEGAEKYTLYSKDHSLGTPGKVGASIKDYGSSERSATIASDSDCGCWGHGPLDANAHLNEYISGKGSSTPIASQLPQGNQNNSAQKFKESYDHDIWMNEGDRKPTINNLIRLQCLSSLDNKTSCSTCPRSEYVNITDSRSSISSSCADCHYQKES